MNKTLVSLAIAGLLSSPAQSIEVIAPVDLQRGTFTIATPDSRVKTLGRVDIRIDLSAGQDDLLDLKVRRSGLTMPNGKAFTAFGAHKESGIIVLAGGPVEHISIASVRDVTGEKEALALFHGEGGHIIAPDYGDIALYDLDFKPLPFSYTPLTPPGSTQIPVNILLDASGSMDGAMDMVTHSTQDFMRALPDFTFCTLTAFNHEIRPLGSMGSSYRQPCSKAAYLLNAPIQASGSTALFEALELGMTLKPQGSTSPVITVAVTDGRNTETYAGTIDSLKAQKDASGARLFVFWAGSYEPDHLKRLADLEFVSTDNLEEELERFFRSLGISISGLQTLNVQAP